MFLAREVWCIADVSSVSPSSELNGGINVNAHARNVRQIL